MISKFLVIVVILNIFFKSENIAKPSAKLRKKTVIYLNIKQSGRFFSQFLYFFLFFVWRITIIVYICGQIRNFDIKITNTKTIFMNKTQLIEKIAAGADLSKADSKKALDATIAAIKDALTNGDKIALVGFGTFSVNNRPARQGVNPSTKQKITIKAKKVVKFKGGADLNNALN